MNEDSSWELIGDGSARFYIDDNYIESVFYGTNVLLMNNGIFYLTARNRYEEKMEALNILMKIVGIE